VVRVPCRGCDGMSLIGSNKALLAAAAAGSVGGWDLANATYNGSPINFFYIGTNTFTPSGLFFKPDGTAMYAVDDSSLTNSVVQYSLSSAWDISTASYVRDFSVQAQETAPTDVFFKPDGTKMYVSGATGDDVNEYSLSTAWDISTASYAQSFSVSSEETVPTGVFFKDDGTKMYISGNAGDDVNEYSLSTAWDISTASYVQSFSVAAQETFPRNLFFKSDGTKMYIIGETGNDVNEYSLSTAWDISTASYVQNFSVNAQEGSPRGIFFKSDGTKMFITGTDSDDVFSYDLSSAWDISTASYTYPTTNYFSVSPQELAPQALFFKSDGTKMYIIGATGDDVNEYSLSSAWDISTASYVQNFWVGSEETNPEGLFFKPDGTKMYIIGTAGDDVNEYSLSSAWDISTASYVQNFSVSLQEISASGLFFKPDGTKMYIIGTTGDDVNEYSLSSAWDISTASYVQNFSVSAQDLTPEDLFFKPDGTKMYIVGSTGDDVNEYSLSSAWDISTASYVQNFSVLQQELNPQGLFFKPDGTKMYIIGTIDDAVWSYDL
jgi:hypothetical protein